MRESYEGEPIRIKIEAILYKHSDKTPDVLAAMIVGYLAADEVISVGNGALEDDPRYNEESEEDSELGKDGISQHQRCRGQEAQSRDYRSIGLDLLF